MDFRQQSDIKRVCFCLLLVDSIKFLFQVYVHLLCDMLDLKKIITDKMTEGENVTDL